MEEDTEYNINELKFITDLENHWITIQKYLNIFNLIQKYCPRIELNGSKLRIIKSEIYERLTEKEKLILYLFNNQALDPDSALKLPEYINISIISESINYLYKKTEDNNFYLTKSGLEFYKYFKKDLSDLIYNNKDIDEIFEITEVLFISDTGLSLEKIHEFPQILEDISSPALSDYEIDISQSIINSIRSDDTTGSKIENLLSLT